MRNPFLAAPHFLSSSEIEWLKEESKRTGQAFAEMLARRKAEPTTSEDISRIEASEAPDA